MSSRLYIVLLAIIVGAITALISSGINNANSQPMADMTNNTSQEHAAHTIDNLVISEHIPLTGQLLEGDYLLLMDFTPFSTSVEGHSHIALKVPCGQDAIPKITIATGVAPKLNTLDLGKSIINGTLDGKEVSLSTRGQSCLFHADLPIGITDIVLINTSNETLDFDRGGYSVTVSIHGTAIQHKGMP
jgi:hypothetical protein